MIHRLLPWAAAAIALAIFVGAVWHSKAAAEVPARVQRWLPDVARHVQSIWHHKRHVALHGALIERESGGRPGVSSPAGAVGLGQFMRPTWNEMVGLYPQFGNDRRNPNTSIALMVRYLHRLHHMCKPMFEGCPRWQCSLGAYNGGIGRALNRIRRHGDDWLGKMPAETRHYVPAILSREPVFIESGWPGEITCL